MAASIEIKPLAELAPPDPSTVEAAEGAYRRGYFQGYHDALDALDKRRTTAARAFDFFFGALAEWRYKRHGGQFETPPRVDN